MKEKLQCRPKSPFHWMLSPWAILIGMGLGFLLGIYQKSLSGGFEIYGNIYLSLLTMCVVPILVSAVSMSLGRALKKKSRDGSLRKLIDYFIFFLLLLSLAGMITGFVGKPGANLTQKSQATLGEVISQKGVSSGLEMFIFKKNPSTSKMKSVHTFISGIVPSNILRAMADDRNLEVLFFAIIFGIALGFLPPKTSERGLVLMELIYHIFTDVITWAMYLLPIALVFLIASQVAEVGIGIFLSMIKFIAVFYLSSLVIFCACALLIWLRVKIPFLKMLSIFKSTLLIVFSTRNSIVAIPSALNALTQGLGFQENSVNVSLPLGVLLGRFGTVFYFAFCVVFVSQLYHISLGIGGFFIVFFGSIFASMASTGSMSIVTLSFLAIILEPLGLPLSAVLVLFIAVDPIVDPVIALHNVFIACSATAMISEKGKQHEEVCEYR